MHSYTRPKEPVSVLGTHWHLIHLCNHAIALLRALHHSPQPVKYNPTISASKALKYLHPPAQLAQQHPPTPPYVPVTGDLFPQINPAGTSLPLCHLSQILTTSWLPNSLLPLLCCCKTGSLTISFYCPRPVPQFPWKQLSPTSPHNPTLNTGPEGMPLWVGRIDLVPSIKERIFLWVYLSRNPETPHVTDELKRSKHLNLHSESLIDLFRL